MASRLEKPETEDDLYLARGDEILHARPLMTGDVLDGVVIPGVSAKPTRGMLVTHPCSMRSDGVNLIAALHVVVVEPSEPVAWSSCPRDRMPLPGLQPETFHVVRLDLMGMVSATALQTALRLACLSVKGVNLLQQRLIWYFTRFEAPTAQLHPLFAPTFEEIDLQEEWVSTATDAGIASDVAATEFHDWIRGDDGTGTRRQDRLKDPQARAAVRRALIAEAQERYKL